MAAVVGRSTRSLAVIEIRDERPDSSTRCRWRNRRGEHSSDIEGYAAYLAIRPPDATDPFKRRALVSRQLLCGLGVSHRRGGQLDAPHRYSRERHTGCGLRNHYLWGTDDRGDRGESWLCALYQPCRGCGQ